MLLELKQYTESYTAEIFFLKDIDYLSINDFQLNDLTLAEGEKANGYKVLTNTQKVVDIDKVNQKIAVIDRIIADQYYNNWSRVVGDIISNYKGISSITSQIGLAERDQKNFLLESVQFMGDNLEELQEKRQEMVGISDGLARNLSLNDLHMLPSGYIYTSIKPVEKIVSEDMLPYINTAFLKAANKIDQISEPTLKVINNDHVYAAFTIPEDKSIMGEEAVLKLKEELMGTSDSSVNKDYYDFLIKRIDQLYLYPELRFMYNEKVYNAYFVDAIKESGQKIVVLMIKDFVNDFSNVVAGDADVYIQDYKAFEVPKSAILNKEDGTHVDIVTKGYFNDSTGVVIEKLNRKNAVLKADANPDLSSGTRIRVFP